MDLRLEKLAKTLVDFSCQIKPGENVLISCNGFDGIPLVKLIIKEVYRAGANPFLDLRAATLERELLLNANEAQVDLIAQYEKDRMEQMDAYISVGSNPNSAELSDVPAEIQQMYDIHYFQPVHYNLRVLKTKWVVLRYPTNSMAQLASMSLEQFEDFYFDVCNLDYAKMSDAMEHLVALMNRTDKVQIKGKGTDLVFSIKDIPAVKCAGHMNIPDGEVYTSPVKDSIEGVLSYTVPSVYRGVTYENIKLTFENGKIVKADCNLPEKINEIFDTDAGARYVGEFALGVNPYITKPMNNILFDEKIMGSFHFTPGQAYKDAYNGNDSSIHWDLVCVQTEAYGGGEIYFDDVLIRKDGFFVHEDLLCLNPDSLK